MSTDSRGKLFERGRANGMVRWKGEEAEGPKDVSEKGEGNGVRE